MALNGGIANPFITFPRYLALPTIINLLMAYLLLKLFYRGQFKKGPLNQSAGHISDPKLARLSQISLIIIAILVLVRIIISFLKPASSFRLTYIVLAATLPIILASPRRFEVARKIDWSTLVFFAATFVLNVIIIQNAEKKAGETLTFLEFIKIGIPLTVINIMVYWLFLLWA